jgi:hypothetical protein
MKGTTLEILSHLKRLEGAWRAEAACGGRPYSERVAAFLDDLRAAELPAEAIAATERLLARRH